MCSTSLCQNTLTRVGLSLERLANVGVDTGFVVLKLTQLFISSNNSKKNDKIR